MEKEKDLFTWEEAIETLAGVGLLPKVFNHARIVSVDDNSVCDITDGCACTTHEKCYSVWSRDTACVNCISYRAVKDHRQFTKLEYNKGNVFLIISVPVEYEGKTYGLELIKNVTDAMLINDPARGKNESINNIFEYFNELATRDMFTRFYNKNYLERKLPMEAREAHKDDKSMTVAMLDVDNFKDINDQYGHIMGDKMLKMVVSVIRQCTRLYDCWTARYGGDEFVIAFRDVPMEEVEQCCQAIQDQAQERCLESKEVECTIGISVGIYEVQTEQDTYESIIEQVDRQLYAAKQKKG